MLKALKFILLTIICVCVMFVAVLFGFRDQLVAMFAPPNMDQALIPDAASQFYDCKGNVIYTTLSVERRIPITIDQIPKHVQNAFISIEDNRFYEHAGIDPRGTGRAIVSTLSGREVQGGSTITQQLAKNAFTNQERTISRKVKEAFLALAMESKYTKQEILTMYLNRIYFGQGSYGLEAASMYYFNRHASELTLPQAACLAAIPKSPNYYNPFANPKDSKVRQELVLDQMVKYKFITKEQAEAAKKEDLQLAKNHEQLDASPNTYFYDMIIQQVIEELGADALYKDGLKVYTTLDMDMQTAALVALKKLNNYTSYKDDKGVIQPQVALAAVEPKTGQVKAIIGGRGQDKFNRAYLGVRQPGSSFKPFVYAAAMQNGFTPASIVEDKEEDFGGGWRPKNSSGKEYGLTSFRTALSHSYNISAVKIARDVGMEKVITTAENMGISTLVDSGKYNDTNLATALGGLTKGVNPIEMASAYAVFANNGVYVKPYSITKIVDRDGKLLYEHKNVKREAITPKSAFFVTSMLQDVLISGTGAGGGIGRPAAGKTGTTDNFIDAWFVGYTPDISTAVWVGDDHNKYYGRMYGGDAPLDIWQSFMIEAHRPIPVHQFVNPGVKLPPEPVIQKEGKPLLDKDGKPVMDASGKPIINPTKESGTKISGSKKSLKERIKEAAGKPKISQKPIVSNKPTKNE